MDQLAELNHTLGYAAHQLGNLIARKEIHFKAGKLSLCFPIYDRSDDSQKPIIRRARTSANLPDWIINRNHFYYIRWKAILTRCYNPSSKAYHHRYGGRKITGDWVCRDWAGPNPLKENVVSFLQFVCALEAAGRRPLESYTIDRIKVDAGYNLANIRWASPKVQALNKGSSTLVIPFNFSNPNFLKAAKRVLKSSRRSNASQRRMFMNITALVSSSGSSS